MKTILITGATSGIGRSCVNEFLKAGYRVLAQGRNPEKLSQLKREEDTQNLVSLCFDLKNLTELNQAMENLEPVHILLNNAGIYARKPWLDCTEADFDEMFSSNVRSLYFLCQKVIANMKHSHSEGLILNNSSTLGAKPVSETSLYSASKAAVISLTQCLAAEFAPKIRANCVLPGVVQTPIHSKNMGEQGAQDFYKEISNMHPLGRVGTPVEIAKLFLALSSNELSWMTGSCITIDGGISLVS